MSFSKIFDIEQKDRSQSEEFKPHNVRVIPDAGDVVTVEADTIAKLSA